jgi:hypothetical protein
VIRLALIVVLFPVVALAVGSYVVLVCAYAILRAVWELIPAALDR